MSFRSKEGPDGTAPGIAVSNRQRARKLDRRWLEKIAAVALVELKIERAELGIILVGTREMAFLNEKFLGHEGATDVITFDYRSSPSRRMRTTDLHGEIFVCVAEAERQAKIFETDWRSEVVRYVVHGILHLIGHDDLRPAARRKMKAAEGRLVRRLSSVR
jgi:probable rRNA maturation factor